MNQRGYLVCLTLPGYPDPGIAIAASRAGALGVLDLEYTRDLDAALRALARLARLGRGDLGVKIDLSNHHFASAVLHELPPEIDTIFMVRPSIATLPEHIQDLRHTGRRVLVEATDAFTAVEAAGGGAAGVVLKGNEAGGRVAEETAFVLFQRCIARLSVPLWVHGGIGPHAAAACIAAGAAGVVLDWQLSLTRESPLPQCVKDRLATMDGSETITIGGGQLGDTFRVYAAPGLPVIDAINSEGQRLLGDALQHDFCAQRWQDTVMRYVGGTSLETLLLLSQDIAFAAHLAERHVTVAGVVDAIEQAIPIHLRTAQEALSLNEHSPLAVSHGTRYPILQGPMTRVSDVASFCEAVALGGALPFLALALLRAPQVEALIQETKERMGERPWGVGILGFVPLELRQEQLEIVRKYRPPFSIIAGGRPDQAAQLEQEGIATYLHVPSPGLLDLFLESGARRLIFEGRECGGHVGPRSSFVLWQSMVDLLVARIDSGSVKAADCHVVFAGGVHDARSAAMVAVMASPLTARGAKIGVLIGTAYLFTAEAVVTGAITEAFQLEALQCDHTVILETGLGHAIRCFDTPFVTTFNSEKERLLAAKHPRDEVRAALDELTLGRLRVASKGIKRHGPFESNAKIPRYVKVSAEEQHAEGMYMSGQVASLRDRVTTIAALHRDVAVGGTEFLKSINATQMKLTMPAQPCDVAIIGMSCLLPKAPTLETYWANILNKVDAIEEVPKDRWDFADYFDPDRMKRDRVYSKWGGFLDAIPFDPVTYGMPPNSVPSIEPLQLLTLEVARAALADAGYSERPFDREHTSLILGAGSGAADLGQLYGFRSTLPMFFGEHADQIVDQLAGALPEWSEDSFAGILMNVAAGRVANRFDLGGANFTVDAACASSLAAVYLGVRELESGTSNMVLVGGIDTMQGPFAYMAFSKTQALSPHGRCRTFDESADGIAISEGLAMLVLKRRADAERDGDRIYAIVRGIGSSSDGRDKGLTAPRPEGQIRALERAYARAGVSPATVGLIEAHGTGTVAGDRAEVSALTTFFARYQANRQTCAIGSVKSMIGHTKCTAGVAGLIKASLALHEAVLPPTLGVEEPNSHINFRETPFYINSETRPWIHRRDGAPRRAGVSAFGFGGTNFHIVLEEYTGAFMRSEETVRREWPSELFIWAATDRVRLLEEITPVENGLAAGAAPRLADLAFTVCSLFENKPKDVGMRLAIVTGSLEDLGKKLARARTMLSDTSRGQICDPTGIFFSDRPLAREGSVAFLFSGQGSQYPNMGRDVALFFGEARTIYEQADAYLLQQYNPPLSARIFPPPTFTDEEAHENRQALTDTHVAQPALGAMAMATCKTLRSLAVVPEMVGGHSYGEFVALWAAGVFDDQTLLRLSEARGRFMRDSAGPEASTMAAVEADASTVLAVLEELKNGVVCANINAPKQTAIAGASPAVEQAVAALGSRGIRARRLPVACAFHSPLVASAQAQFAATLAQVNARSPAMPVYSNTTGMMHRHDPAQIIQVMAEHLVQPVQFVRQIEAMYRDGARIFVEVGPKAILTSLVNQILAGHSYAAVATDQEGRPGLYQLQLTLARLAAEGVGVQTGRLFTGRCLHRLDLNALAQSSSAPVYTPTTCLVNGTRSVLARDADKSLRSLRVDLSTLVKGNGHATGGLADRKQREIIPPQEVSSNGHQIPAAPVQQATGPAPAYCPDRVALMAQFQQVMSRFLDTQRAVMLTYLGGPTGSRAIPAHTTSIHSAATHPVTADAPSEYTAGGRRPLEAPRIPEPGQPTLPDQAAAPVPPPAPPAVTSATSERTALMTRESATTRLLTITADRTGYPPEMLGLDLDLEADLGIDSIKRVEILGSFRQQIGDRADQSEAAMEQLARIKTLRGIIEWVFEHAAKTSPPTSGDNNTPALEVSEIAAQISELPGARVHRSLAKVAPAPPITQTAGIAPDAVLLVTDDGCGIAVAIAERFGELGARVALVKPGTVTGEIEPGVYTCAFESAPAVQELATTVRARQGAVAGIIHLLPLRPAPVPEENLHLAKWRERLAQDVRGLFHLAQTFADELHAAARRGGAAVLAVTGMGGAFGLHGLGSGVFAGNGGVAGLTKTLALEWPDVRVRVIDVDHNCGIEKAVSYLFAEFYAADRETEIGYLVGQRSRLRVDPQNLAPSDQGPAITQSSVILLTGGARGITAHVALHLARHYRPILLLAGRSPQPALQEAPETGSLQGAQELKAIIAERMRREGTPVTPVQVEGKYRRLMQEREMRDTFRSIEATGATVRYFPVDMRDEGPVRRLLDGIYRDYGRLDGVVHGAGIIEDKLIERKDPTSFRRVFETKTDSAFLLARLLRFDQLRFLVFFSSISGRFGNPGQGDYAAANEVLNKLADQLDRAHPTRVVAINWGPWATGGMISPELERRFGERGVRLIPPDLGARMFDDELRLGRKGDAEVIITGGAWVAAPNRETAEPVGPEHQSLSVPQDHLRAVSPFVGAQ